MDYFEGLTLTKPLSYVTVILCKNPSGFLIEFPQNKKIFAKLVNIPGALFGDDSPFNRSFYIPRNQYQTLRQVLEESAVWRDQKELQADLDFLGIPEESLQDVLGRLPNDIDTSFMKIEPYAFQKLAIAWAAADKGLGKEIKGGLLGDQMGLGKTIEAMAIAGYFKQQGWIRNCLVVTPATVKTQWAQEIDKFANERSIIVRSKYKGFDDRKELYEKIKQDKPFFTIINYELLYQKEVTDTVVVNKNKQSGKEKKKKIFGDYLDLKEIQSIGYDMIIIDEAHKMKNPDTEIAKVIRQIDVKYKLLMTGTPIQKELKNIFQLFDYIDPGILSNPNLDFEKRRLAFETQFLMVRLNPFVYSNRKQKIPEVFGEKNEIALRKRFNPFLLRRLTQDVSDEMPDQVIIEIVVEFNDEQLKILSKIKEQIDVIKGNLEKEKDMEKIIILENTLKGLLQTRMIVCDSPSLLLESNSNLVKRIVGKKKNFARVQKLDRLLEIVEEIVFDNNEKVVIFSKYARTADLLQDEIKKLINKKAKEEKLPVYDSFVYKGKTKQGCKFRDVLVKENKDTSAAVCSGCPYFKECDTRTKYAWLFQNDPLTRVIVATDAANFGVNLQEGNHLINYDFPDEFSTYLQRNGRIRRLGSKHDKVFIYNMFTIGGKDEQVYKAIERQIKLNDKVIENRDMDLEAIKKANEEIEKAINDL
ncbi:DEAD/DEAH box helicase [Bacillus sp. Brlt_9]|uniref:DEAD/DEAH box helicase n=1 Tax=Bacillus sp. Brlt_9 TaxID=3110916 RepID=UPI003F7BEEEA